MRRVELSALVVLAACGRTVEWETDEASAFSRARREHAAVLVHFYTSWSITSVELYRRLHDADLTGYVPIRIDISAQIGRYATHPPGVVLLAADGKVLDTVGEIVGPDQLQRILDDHRPAWFALR